MVDLSIESKIKAETHIYKTKLLIERLLITNLSDYGVSLALNRNSLFIFIYNNEYGIENDKDIMNFIDFFCDNLSVLFNMTKDDVLNIIKKINVDDLYDISTTIEEQLAILLILEENE